ncbi:sugar transferase [Gulosibacter chungangensis]|uniref:sugar transferase n=1 Tax=Gulosibacter chungangensis TaxID=979746 RepID=UPI001CE419A7|nr:sugar transferase [Gulosibacter chungangensis]
MEVATTTDAYGFNIPYWVFSTGLVFAWMFALALRDSRSDRVVGAGSSEYINVVHASVALFGIVAIVAFLTRIEVARGYLLLGLPMGITLLLLARWLWRQWLVSKRALGAYMARVLLVGSRSSVQQILYDLTKNPGAGYLVVGACITDGKIGDKIEAAGRSVPVFGSADDIPKAMESSNADTVAVTSTGNLSPMKVKQISWSLEAGRQHLILAPSITDIAGPRIHTRPVSGLPLIHVETPRYSRGQRFVKRTADLISSILGVVAISPLLIFLAVIVKCSSRGPILFRQKRIGRNGREFEMLKFRSMVENAEDLLPSLLDQRDSGNEVLFKMKDDPRITKVGRFMRRYSLDELPQLFNVIRGNMSLVGPRPPLAREVETYDSHVHRRFLMKPGITGAWQVSGRSSLSWDESVRLDLAYIENWSLSRDLIILLKTAKAVLAPGETAA